MAKGRFLGLRWITITLIMLGAIINYLTRNSLGVAAGGSTLLSDLGIHEVEYSYVILAFQLAIMCQPIVGYLIDLIGLRRGMTIFAVVWSISSVLHAWVSSWWILAALRSVMGFAEGSANPSGMKVVSLWFPARERGFAAGLYNIGASAGSMLAPPLVAGAIDARRLAIGVRRHRPAWFPVGDGVVLLYRDPTHPQSRLSQEERELIAQGQEQNLKAVDEKPSVLSILATRNFWGIAIPRFLADPTWGTLSFWLPLYLTQVRGFDLAGIAMFAWMPFLAADLGCFFGPTIVHFLQKGRRQPHQCRRIAFTVGALMMIGVMFVDSAQNVYVGIALLCLAGFAHQTLSVTVITMASDLYKQNAGRDRCGHGRLLRQFQHHDLKLADWRSGAVGGVWAVLRRARRARPHWRDRDLVSGARSAIQSAHSVLVSDDLRRALRRAVAMGGEGAGIGERHLLLCRRADGEDVLLPQWVFFANWTLAIGAVVFGLYLSEERVETANVRCRLDLHFFTGPRPL